MEKRSIVNGRFKDVNYIVPEVPFSREKATGVLLENIFISYNDDTRMMMAVSFSKSTVALINAEPNIFGSAYLKKLVDYNTQHKKEKHNDFKLIKKISRNIMENDSKYTIIFINKGKLCIDDGKIFEIYAEGTAEYRVRNKDNNFISRVTGISESGELMTGINARVAYTSAIPLYEDSQIISKGFSERTKALKVKEIELDVKKGTIFTGRGFPKIGEVLSNSKIAFSTNVENNYSSLIDPTIHYGRDTVAVLPCEGYFLGDMDLYYDYKSLSPYIDNEDFDRLQDGFILDLIKKDHDYLKEIYITIQEEKKKGIPLSIDVKRFIDDYEYRFVHKATLRDNIYPVEFLRINFYYLYESPSGVGQKLSGTYGNKGTVGKVYDDEKMYTTEKGQVIDLLLAQHGIIGRSNPGQNMELTVNFYNERLIDIIREEGIETEKAWELITTFISLIDIKNYEYYNQLINNGVSVEELVDDLVKLGVIVMRVHPDSTQFNITTYPKLVEFMTSISPKYPTEESLLLDIYKEGKFVGRGMVAYMYIRRAKQSGLSKQSLRGIGAVGSDGANKKTEEYAINNNPTKMSEKDELDFASTFSPSQMRDLEDNESKLDTVLAIMQGLNARLL